MFAYKNTSRTTKTFFGVEFKPQEIHQVPGYINDKKFMRIMNFDEVPKEPPKRAYVRKTKPKLDDFNETKEIELIEEDVLDGTDSHK